MSDFSRRTTPAEPQWSVFVQRPDRERAAHVAEHGPGCELCGNVPRRGLDDDHDHKTGRHRGWLCARCNRFLHGLMSPAWLRAAADYLEART